MILEIANIRIQSGQNAAFEQALQHALASVISQAAEIGRASCRERV